MTAYVLDASVAAKWVLPSEDELLAPEAIELLHSFAAGEINFSVPDLFWPEMGNILWKSALVGRISEKTAHEALDWLRTLNIAAYPARDLITDALTIALAFDRAVYDALYVALAIASGRSLVTADERLANAVGTSLPVRWLASVV